MTTLKVTAGCLLLALSAAACNGGADGSTATTAAESATTTTTAPERPASTTTTAYDPAAVEGQVEAAYLKSWDVYAEAVYNLELDEQALADVYAGEALALRTAEVERRARDKSASFVRVDHSYEVVVSDAASADIIDNFVNHQVLIDPVTKEPIEPDPNEALLVHFRMRLIGELWRVVFIEKVNM